jgi:hypothetical protein
MRFQEKDDILKNLERENPLNKIKKKKSTKKYNIN